MAFIIYPAGRVLIGPAILEHLRYVSFLTVRMSKLYDYSDRTFTNLRYHHSSFPPIHRGPAAMKQWIGDRLSTNPEQRRILWILGLQSILIILMYQWSLTRLFLYPFQLISTVFHEFGHALMVRVQTKYWFCLFLVYPYGWSCACNRHQCWWIRTDKVSGRLAVFGKSCRVYWQHGGRVHPPLHRIRRPSIQVCCHGCSRHPCHDLVLVGFALHHHLVHLADGDDGRGGLLPGRPTIEVLYPLHGCHRMLVITAEHCKLDRLCRDRGIGCRSVCPALLRSDTFVRLWDPMVGHIYGRHCHFNLLSTNFL